MVYSSLSLEQLLASILGHGEMSTIPEQAIEELYKRRLQQIQKGPWVEAHYKPVIKKKRRQQKANRRRNRG